VHRRAADLLVCAYNPGKGRLASVTVGSSPGVTSDYLMNAYGERVLKRPYGTPAAATHYHYGLDGTLLAESEADGDPAVEYIVLPGGLPLAVIPDPLGAPAGIAYVHPDHLGAAAAITDSGEDVDWELVAGPFGELEDASGSLTFNPRFPGQYADTETGVRYNLMRDYDPSLGRYLQSDPIGLMGGLNTYAYVGGNPVNWVDPLGLDVTVSLYPGAAGFGHVGVGVNTSTTTGFYPNSSDAGMVAGLPVSGSLRTDTRVPERSVTIPTTNAQDDAVQSFLDQVMENPGLYDLYERNCTTIAREALAAAGIQTPETIWPRILMEFLDESF
jgi:RHS repeat-associated protein